MAKTFILLVPTILESQMTGYLGGVEKTYRGARYRIEFHPAGLSITKDGLKVRRWDDVPAAVQAAVRSAREMLGSRR